MKHIKNIIIIGFGSIAQGLLPLLSNHYNGVKITIFEKHISEKLTNIATEFSATLDETLITAKNFKRLLSPHLNGKYSPYSPETKNEKQPLLNIIHGAYGIWRNTNDL